MYKFSLEPVLKFRDNVKKKHAQEMANLKSDFFDAKKDLKSLVSYAKEISEKLGKEEKGGISPKEALLFRSFIKKREIDICQQKKMISALNGRIEKKREVLNNASIEKKVVEKLKEKDRKKFFKEMTVQHQKEMDEIAISRHTKR